ncbi:type II secretion system minor pseudopilin GspK [Pseudomonas sp. RIT-PI-AD]|uniref:type II secretion system minor pseudopilin GspK n=1 Tax=Pseudomonas sp. RIT-PI-AD TaxID=3035294 RepID=UPI0021D883A5|nr:type II secretion system minor pseudopilin GspK [Pseudomonas sp. RIT-PI-AD]
MNRPQRGVALLTVLLVVAVVTVVCAGLIARQQLAIRASANQLHTRQAWQYALGGETLARAILRRDFRLGNPAQQIDHLGEAWAQPTRFPLDDGGELEIRIEDLNGRFNLNALLRQAGQNEETGAAQADQKAIKQFRLLLTRLGIDASVYPQRLLDWLDPNKEMTGVNGAEDDQYLLLKPPYRAANRPIKDPSELRLLLDMKETDFRRLMPYISALPADASLNVNTASAPVLSSLAETFEPSLAQAVTVLRGRAGFASVDAFTSLPVLAGLGELDGMELSVRSQYFQVVSEVRLAERRLVLVSILQRGSDGRVQVLSRDLGQDGLPSVPVEEPKG